MVRVGQRMSLRTKRIGACAVAVLICTLVITGKRNSHSEQGLIPIDENAKCEDTLDRTDDENAKIVRNYPIGNSEPYLEDLGLLDIGKERMETDDLPVVVTTATSNHYAESLNMIIRLQKEIFPKVGNLTIIYYDLGLTKGQRQKIQQICSCEMRDFPFEKYPSHVRNIRGFAWKPIMIQTVLKKHGFVMWMDASVSIVSGDFNKVFQKVKKEGISLSHSGASYSLAQSTDVRTMEMLGEKPCTFTGVLEFYATFIIIHKSDFVLRHIMRPWLSCALTDGCMSMPRDSMQDCNPSLKVYGSCHRFDQSVLSIIIQRLHHDSIDRVNLDENLRWTKCAPVLPSCNCFPNFVNEFLFGLSSLFSTDECRNFI